MWAVIYALSNPAFQSMRAVQGTFDTSVVYEYVHTALSMLTVHNARIMSGNLSSVQVNRLLCPNLTWMQCAFFVKRTRQAVVYSTVQQMLVDSFIASFSFIRAALSPKNVLANRNGRRRDLAS